MRRMCMNCCLA